MGPNPPPSAAIESEPQEAFFESFLSKYWMSIRLVVLVTLDAVTIGACYYASYVLRLDDFQLKSYLVVFFKALPIVVATYVITFYLTGIYRQVWRFASINSAILVAKSVIAAAVISVAIKYSLGWEQMPPRSITIINALLAFLVVTSIRFGWRMLAAYQSPVLNLPEKKRCLIYGAGRAGELLMRHVIASHSFPYKIVGFLDDDRNKIGRLIYGVKIFGCGQDLARVAKEQRVDTVILALHATPGKIVREVMMRCHDAGVTPLIMPEIATSLGTDPVQLRPIDVKDLLRRSPKSVDWPKVQQFFKNQVVLITGAGGSIGSELCRQVVSMKPKTVILLDASEFNLYKIDQELRATGIKDVQIHAILGSVTEARVVESVFQDYAPTCVIHAAAYKHVSLVELNPIEGILNNVLGTKIVAEMAILYGVKHFLLISTDKAVNPSSVMGATKRCCELVVQLLHHTRNSECKFSSVRFGNVLGSSGSVIPRFLDQIQSGGPVTVTHPDVTRYFMLIPEAVGLCLQSIAVATGGELFILNMGEPVKILDMAKQLILLAGKRPGRDIDIVFSGLLPGEKLFEELVQEGSELPTLNEDVFVVTPTSFDGITVLNRLNELLEAAQRRDISRCRTLLWQLASIEWRGTIPPTLGSELPKAATDSADAAGNTQNGRPKSLS